MSKYMQGCTLLHYFFLSKNILLYENLLHQLHIIHKIRMVLHHNIEFYGLEIVLLKGINFDNKFCFFFPSTSYTAICFVPMLGMTFFVFTERILEEVRLVVVLELLPLPLSLPLPH